MPTIAFRIYGDPEGQPRTNARVIFVAGKPKASVYTPATAAAWVRAVALHSKRHRPRLPFAGPVTVDLEFIFRRPKYHFNSKGELKPAAPHHHTSVPDRDNCEKLILDSFTKMQFWGDDAQVCDGRISKRYAAAGEDPGVQISITSEDTLLV